MYTEKIQLTHGIFHGIPFESIGQHNQCDIQAAHDGKVGCNAVEYLTAFLHSDWLYFLWHGIV